MLKIYEPAAEKLFVYGLYTFFCLPALNLHIYSIVNLKMLCMLLCFPNSVAMRVSDSDFTTMEDLSEQDMLLFTKESTQDVIPMAPISVRILSYFHCMKSMGNNLSKPIFVVFSSKSEIREKIMVFLGFMREISSLNQMFP